MKAWICKAFGDAPMLIDCDEPFAQSRDVIIDIAACGVNFADTLILEGKYQKRPRARLRQGLKLPGQFRWLVRMCGALKSGIGLWQCPTGAGMGKRSRWMQDL